MRLADLADAVIVDEADVRCLISDHLAVDLHDDEIPPDVAQAVHDVLNPYCERTVPWLYDEGPMERWRAESGLRKVQRSVGPDWVG